MRRLFGTDGIRGVAGVDVTADLARRLGTASVAVLGGGDGPVVVVGRDPRPSGPELLAGLVGGLTVAGARVVDLGVIPTPAVARAVESGLPGVGLPAYGVVISASHNPAHDNGLKLFGAGGSKLPVTVEDRIEAAVAATHDGHRPVSSAAPEPLHVTDHDWYVDHLLRVTESFGRLDGLGVVVDCANGAASQLAPAVYAAAGADVVAIGIDTDGSRINDGFGATHLDPLRRAVVDHGADVGIAHDGDADRCLAVDAHGDVVDGDAILAVLAVALHERGALTGDAIAATVMSNQGLVVGLARHGIGVRRTDVGDRAVLERIAADGLVLGGEQSGHVVLRNHATTGDGLLTALALLGRLGTSGRPLRELASVVQPLPQVLVNVRVDDRDAAVTRLRPLVAAAEAELGAAGRVLVRPSGTEPLVRVMVEAPTRVQADEIAARLADAIR